MPQIGSLFVSLGMNTAQFTQQSQAAAAALVPIEVNSRKLNFALTNLGFQINDVASGLAQGQAPMRIFAQQAGQIVQLFTQGGGFSQVMRGAGQAIAGFITPTRVAVAAVAAMGAGFGVLLTRAFSNTEQLRQLNLVLERTGQLATNLDVGAQNARLRSLGVSRDLANQQRLAMARDPRINFTGAFGERLTTLGANLGAFSGLGPEAGIGQLMEAIKGGPEAVIRLAASTKALSAEQAALLLASLRTTDGLKAQETAVRALERQMKNTAKQAMDPLTDATNTLAGAWDKMLSNMSKTRGVEGARQVLIDLFNTMGGLAAGEYKPGATSGPNLPSLMGLPMSRPGGPMTPRPGYQSPDQPGGAVFPLPSRMSREEALRILDPSSPTAPTLGQATRALNALGGQALVNEGLREMGMVGGGRMWRSSQQMAQSSRFGLGAGTGAEGGFSRDPSTVIAVTDAIARQREEIARAAKSHHLWNIEQEATAAAEAARAALPEGATPGEREIAASLAAAAARAKFNVELTKENTLTGMRIETERKVAQAMLESEGAAVRVKAAEEARIETLQRGGDEAVRTAETLAMASARAEGALAGDVAGGRRDIEVARERVSLFGESTEHVERQIALLRVRQQVEAAGVPIAQSIVDARIRGVNALHDELNQLAAQRRLMDQIREVAGVFENSFSQAFDSIVDGTFNLRKALGSLLRDLGKTLASSAFKRLLGGDSGEGGGILGMIAGRLFGLGGGGLPSDAGYDVINANPSFGGGGIPGAQTGARWRVGGYGAMDSQLVAFRASPGEMIDVSQPGQHGGGGGEVIRIDLNPSEGWVAGVADQQIVTRSGTIIDLAVRQSAKTVRQNFAGMTAETQRRQM
jgi:Prophage tail length tape measure protein